MKTCARAQYAEYEAAAGKRSVKTCGRSKDGKRQYDGWVVVVFCFKEKCGRGKIMAEKKSGRRRATTV